MVRVGHALAHRTWCDNPRVTQMPTGPATTPTRIHADRAAGTLAIDWADGHVSVYGFEPLRWLPLRILPRGGGYALGWLDSAPTLTPGRRPSRTSTSSAITPSRRTGPTATRRATTRSGCCAIDVPALAHEPPRARQPGRQAHTGTRRHARGTQMIVVTTPTSPAIASWTARAWSSGSSSGAAGWAATSWPDSAPWAARSTRHEPARGHTPPGARPARPQRHDGRCQRDPVDAFRLSELSGTMSEIVAYGTAVIVEPDKSAKAPTAVD